MRKLTWMRKKHKSLKFKMVTIRKIGKFSSLFLVSESIFSFPFYVQFPSLSPVRKFTFIMFLDFKKNLTSLYLWKYR